MRVVVQLPQSVRSRTISDIRPEYAELLWGIRHNYPSLFALRTAVQGGGISPARAKTILHFQRYEDQDAESVVKVKHVVD